MLELLAELLLRGSGVSANAPSSPPLSTHATPGITGATVETTLPEEAPFERGEGGATAGVPSWADTD